MNRAQRAIPSIGAAILLIAGCSTDHSTSPGATAPLAPSPLVAKPTPSPQPQLGGWVSGLSNPWLAFTPGKVFHYRAETPDGVETSVVEVTSDTKVIQGVVTTVVHDQESLDGSLIEDTFDWYAQDQEGNVWYFGEDSKQIDHGAVVGTEGSWQAGVDGARAGIVMLALPKVGMKYEQEFAPDVAEDMARVQSLSASVEVPLGSFDHCLQTVEWSPLEKGSRETKFYARGVGEVLTLEDKRRTRVELVSVTP